MNGRDLAALNDLYRRAAALMGNPPDLGWLLGELAADERYERLNLLLELRRFVEYWSDCSKGKRPKSHKRALRNWLKKALEDRRGPSNDRAPEPPPNARSPKPAVDAATLSDRDRAGQIWAEYLRSAAGLVDDRTFDTWLRPTTGLGFRGDVLVVGVPNEIFAGQVPTVAPPRDRLNWPAPTVEFTWGVM